MQLGLKVLTTGLACILKSDTINAEMGFAQQLHMIGDCNKQTPLFHIVSRSLPRCEVPQPKMSISLYLEATYSLMITLHVSKIVGYVEIILSFRLALLFRNIGNSWRKSANSTRMT